MKSLMSFFIFLFSMSAFASELGCPKKIDTKQSITSKNSGWAIFEDTNDIHILKSIDFYDSNPIKMVLLAPDNADSGQDPTWTFAGNRVIWQVCRYTNTKVSLTRKMKPQPKNCTVKYNKQIHPQIDSIICN